MKGGFRRRVDTYTRQRIGSAVAGHNDNSAAVLPYDRHQFPGDSHRSQEIDIYLILCEILRLPLELAEHHHPRVIHQCTQHYKRVGKRNLQTANSYFISLCF